MAKVCPQCGYMMIRDKENSMWWCPACNQEEQEDDEESSSFTY